MVACILFYYCTSPWRWSIDIETVWFSIFASSYAVWPSFRNIDDLVKMIIVVVVVYATHFVLDGSVCIFVN